MYSKIINCFFIPLNTEQSLYGPLLFNQSAANAESLPLNASKFVSAMIYRVTTQSPQAENTWCMRQFVYIENCMGKSPIVKFLLPQMCDELVSFAEFRAILTTHLR